ncbi:MAG: DUF6456 domain-containing protein [Mangrovicoccus sp.]|nr:DUF6456 domain-containing protein [Mangrovicoccus sp.]
MAKRSQETPPGWLSDATLHYLLHIELGTPIRAIARAVGCHASTISRQVRKVESRRDDPLVDAALIRLGSRHFPSIQDKTIAQEEYPMSALNDADFTTTMIENDRPTLRNDARNALRRMAETGAVMAVAAEMEKGVIMRALPGGESARTAVVSRELAETMALRDWITCITQGRISRYEITSAGRAALKRDAEERASQQGFGEAMSPFQAQHGDWKASKGQKARKPGARPRINLAESPLAALARRRDKNGKAFLHPDLVMAGERLREDFELAQMGPRVAQNWESFLTGPSGSAPTGSDPTGTDSNAARERVSAALSDLGAGLGDVVLRCCCYLEGMEAVEKQMGWSARSGKIVLRIALQHLHRHYQERLEGRSPLIG